MRGLTGYSDSGLISQPNSRTRQPQDTKEEIYVTVPEEADETMIPPGTQKPGAVYTIGENEGTHARSGLKRRHFPGLEKRTSRGHRGVR